MMKSLILICFVLVLAAASLSFGEDDASSTTAVISPEPIPTMSVTSDDAIYPLTPERQELLNSYSRFRNVWRFVSFFVSVAVLVIILFSGLSAKMRDWASVAHRRFFVLWLFVAMLLIVEFILRIPFSIYRGFFVEQSYGFLNQSFGDWFGEKLLGLGLSILISIIPAWFFYWAVSRLRRWWLWFSLGAIPFIVFAVVIAPVVISPLYNDFTPLEDKALEARLLSLADRAGIEGSDVFQVDASRQTSKINAYVTGLFGSKRIVLYDTLIKNFTVEEIEFVMAHEMGHYVMHHIWWGIGVSILSLLCGLWAIHKLIPIIIRRWHKRLGFSGLADFASLPLVLLCASVLSFVFQPVTNAASRVMERQADTYGMRMSGVDSESAVRAFDKLSVYNLSDPSPSPLVEFWFYSHPALSKRMAFARSWKAESTHENQQ